MINLRCFLLQLTILCLAQTAQSQTQDWMWARTSGSVSNDYSNAVCTDADGNVYITGTFQGATITFGSHVLYNTTEGFLDFFVAKYDSQGNVLWAISDGGKKNDYAYGICADLIGNVFITGYFLSDSLVLGPSIMTNPSAGSYSQDVFIAKYDQNGNAQWGQSGEADAAYGFGISSDASGNVYIAGSFAPPSISFGSNTFQSYGSYDMFLVKYDTDGNVLWANQMGGSSNDEARAIHVDPSGNAYITGWFINEANFGGVSLVSTNNAYQEIFAAKYDSSGNIVWANYAVVPYAGNYASGRGIVSDLLGNVYITGYFQYSLSFGNDTLGNAGNHGLFLAKYDSNGNPVWGRSPGGTGNDFGAGLCTEPNGNVLLTGYFESSFLNFGGYPVLNNNVGFNDAFVARYDPNGNATGVIGIGGPDDEFGIGVTSSPNGDIYSTGYFGSYSLDFSGTIVTNNGSYDTFLAEVSNDAINSVLTMPSHTDVKLFPNPASHQIHVLSEGHAEIRVYDIASRRILERQFTNKTTIDVSALPAGLYVYELIRDGTLVKGKFVRE